MSEKMKFQQINTNDIGNESDAEILIKDALMLVESGVPECAAWRLADALLLVSKNCAKGTPGIDKPTGMGAMLKVRS